MSFDLANKQHRIEANELLVDDYNNVRVLAIDAALKKDTCNDPTYYAEYTDADRAEASNTANRTLVDARLAMARIEVLGALNAHPYRSTVATARAHLWDLREEMGMNPTHSQREMAR